MRACAETSNAYRLCLFTMDHGAIPSLTNPEYCDNVSFSMSEKSSEEDEEEEDKRR